MQMDTDSMYMTVSAKTLSEVVRLELRDEYERAKNQSIALDKCSTYFIYVVKQYKFCVTQHYVAIPAIQALLLFSALCTR
jgi:hypothetical protein